MAEALGAWAPRVRAYPPRPLLTTVLIGSLLALPSPLSAQAGWDPDVYLELSRNGARLFHEATHSISADDPARVERLFEAGAYMKEALGMLRSAMAEGHADDAPLEAQADHFTLTENLSVVWLGVNACAPAERLIEEALANSALPATNRSFLEGLRPEVAACRVRLNAWDWTRYAGLVARTELRMEQAIRGSTIHRPLLDQAARVSEDALEQYRAALFAGRLGHMPTPDPVAELFDRYDLTLRLLLELGECDWAQHYNAAAEQDAATLLSIEEPGLASSEDLPMCRPYEEPPPASETVEPQPADSPEAEDDGFRDLAAYALLSGSALLTVGLVVLEVTSVGDRDELDGLQSQCRSGPCDYGRASELADSIDQRRIVGGVLLGAAIASGAAGVVLLLTGGEESTGSTSSHAAIFPVLSAEGVGAALRLRY